MPIFKNKQPEVPRRRRSDDASPDSTTDYTQRNTFQRNRTLVGKEYMSGTSSAPSPRTHVHYLALRRRKVGLVFLIVVAVTAVLGLLLVEFTARAKVTVVASGYTRQLDLGIYEEAINEYLTTHPFSRLRFALDASDLSAYLSTVLPEVDEVTAISFDQIGVTDVTLSMRKPVAGWTIDTRQYFVDANGVAFERNYFNDPTVQIIDNSGIGIQQGIAVASNRFLGFVGKVVSQAQLQGYTVTQASIPADTTRQLEIQLKDVRSRIKFSIDRPAGEQVEDMARSIEYLTARNSSPTYIDVRVSGKAFYR